MRQRGATQKVMVISLGQTASTFVQRRITLTGFVMLLVMTEMRFASCLFVRAGIGRCSPDGLERQHHQQHDKQKTTHVLIKKDV